MGVLLHQRGLLVLHASAITIGEGAIAFVGAKGAGKSTLTAALAMRGHRLLSDDVTALRSDEASEPPMVLPGPASMKLWPDSAQAVGLDPTTLPKLYEQIDKHVLRFDRMGGGQPQPLQCIYVLEQGAEVASAQILTHEAFAEMVRHTYAARFLGPAALGPRHFRQCASLLKTVAIRRLTRTDDVNSVEHLADRIEAEWK